MLIYVQCTTERAKVTPLGLHSRFFGPDLLELLEYFSMVWDKICRCKRVWGCLQTRVFFFFFSFSFPFFSFFFHPIFIIFALLFSLPRSRNSDPGSHTYSRLFSAPPRYGSCLAFLSREDLSPFFPWKCVWDNFTCDISTYQYIVFQC